MATQKKVLIIGNGFDLHHELPTKYSQFIEVLKNIETLEIEKNTILTFENLFNNVDKYHEIKKRFNTEKISYKNDRILEIKKKLETNLWFQSFKSKLEFEYWIDVENEIKETLIVFDKIIKQTNLILKNNINCRDIAINPNLHSDKNLKIDVSEFAYLDTFRLLTVKFHNIVDDISSPSGFSL
jgi:hypothetical protein